MQTTTTTTPTDDVGAYLRRPAVLLLAAPLVVNALVSVIRGSRHFAWAWDVHAHHHLVVQIAESIGLSVVGLLVLTQALRLGQRWAWWALAVTGVAVFGSYWLGNVTVGLGLADGDATMAGTAQTVLAVLYTAGLVRTLR